jgi:hypothetical protein
LFVKRAKTITNEDEDYFWVSFFYSPVTKESNPTEHKKICHSQENNISFLSNNL